MGWQLILPRSWRLKQEIHAQACKFHQQINEIKYYFQVIGIAFWKHDCPADQIALYDSGTCKEMCVYKKREIQLKHEEKKNLT